MLTSPLLVLSLSCSISWGVPLHGSPDDNEVTEDKCYSEMSDPYRLFGSWTSYFAVDNERAQTVEMPGCRPKSFWMFVRHGSRRPSVGQINATNTRGPHIKAAVVKNHQDGKGHLCGKDLGAFLDWHPHLTEADDHLLVQAGRDEMKVLGERFRARLPSLFETFDNKEVIFRSTKTQRTIESAREFFEGAFPNYEFDLPAPILNDTVLRFYKFCKNFKDLDSIEEGSESLVEMKMFEDSDVMKGMIERVNQRLGFNETDSKLNLSDIYVMWDTCRYEMQARETPVFCSPFTKKDLEIMEYHEELKYWRSHGFGGNDKMNRLVACPLMKNMAEALENNRVTVHFGHQDGLTTLLTMMGINEDEVAPTHSNYQAVTSSDPERKYRMSKMNPMGGNFGVLLSECDLEPKKRVVAYLQERPVNLPGCGHTECDWETFKTIYEKAIQCPFDEECDNN